jgi:hypothetical protein
MFRGPGGLNVWMVRDWRSGVYILNIVQSKAALSEEDLQILFTTYTTSE